MIGIIASQNTLKNSLERFLGVLENVRIPPVPQIPASDNEQRSPRGGLSTPPEKTFLNRRKNDVRENKKSRQIIPDYEGRRALKEHVQV